MTLQMYTFFIKFNKKSLLNYALKCFFIYLLAELKIV